MSAGRIDGAERAAALERLTPTRNVLELRDAAIIIEAVADEPEAKATAVIRSAEAAPPAVIATTTARLSVTALAARTSAPVAGRRAALHRAGSPQSRRRGRGGRAAAPRERSTSSPQLVTDLGKQPVPVRDRPGFLVDRLQVPYLNDAVKCLDEGLASARDIDVALELGLGYPRGPLTVLDGIGPERHLRTGQTALHAALHDPHFAPPPMLRRRVDAGRGFREEEIE